ncbi:MAG: GNAT family N-acetyltransferase [Candidatus Thorarchaeota archaeon]|nr:MAG: GNAT family N-acetyltransferase [Candidatus Thorarchaeota archaeon]
MTSNDILEDHSDEAIISGIEGNLLTLIDEDMSHVPEPYKPQIDKREDMVRYYTGIMFPVENGVYVLSVPPNELESRVDEQIEFFRSRKVPHMWWISASSSPPEIENLLIENGLVKGEWDSPAMAMDLRRLDETHISDLMSRSGATVTKVTTDTKFEEWMEVFRGTSGWTEEACSAYQKSCKRLLTDTEYSNVILAEIDDEPVGASLSVLRNGVVGLYSVGTMEKHRGKGIGSLVSLAAIMDGQRKGYEIATLCSTEMGMKVYPRLGFKEYFRYKFYIDMLE